MSASSDFLSDDVLSKIFENIHVSDVISCAKVCRKWRCVINSLVLGRRFFQRMKKSSAVCRRAWHKMALDETNLKPGDYKNICWSSLQYLQQVDDNWRTGNFKLTTTPLSHFKPTSDRLRIGEDFIAVCDIYGTETLIFDKESVELKHTFGRNEKWIYELIDRNTFVSCVDYEPSVHDINSNQLIRRFECKGQFSQFQAPKLARSTAKLFAFFSSFTVSMRRLDVWRVDNASNWIRVKAMEIPFNDYFYEWKVDEQFIHSIFYPFSHPLLKKDSETTCHFYSTGVVHNSGLERSFSVAKRFIYDHGLIFFIHHGLIRILDVASGTYLNDIHVDPSRLKTTKYIKVNSKFVVMSTSYINEKNLHVYSLQALKNISPSDPLVTVIKLELETFDVDDVLVDETQIVCLMNEESKRAILVIDFGALTKMPAHNLFQT
jgi:hypothetical protein